jgi:hypothetical protein
VVDVGGRRVMSRDVGAMGAGLHAVDLANGGRIAPGVYWVRLTQGPSSRMARVAVVDSDGACSFRWERPREAAIESVGGPRAP